MPHKTSDWSDSDPSFIRTNASELVDFARRLGLSNDEMREAVDSGLIKPAAHARVRLDAAPSANDPDPRDRPEGGL
jgi:hypothetical protein